MQPLIKGVFGSLNALKANKQSYTEERDKGKSKELDIVVNAEQNDTENWEMHGVLNSKFHENSME